MNTPSENIAGQYTNIRYGNSYSFEKDARFGERTIPRGEVFRVVSAKRDDADLENHEKVTLTLRLANGSTIEVSNRDIVDQELGFIDAASYSPRHDVSSGKALDSVTDATRGQLPHVDGE